MWRMRMECRITKTTDTHSEYVILIAFPCERRSCEQRSCEQWLCEQWLCEQWLCEQRLCEQWLCEQWVCELASMSFARTYIA